jgi:hypothetical protein
MKLANDNLACTLDFFPACDRLSLTSQIEFCSAIPKGGP